MENLPKPPQIPKIQDLYSDLELAKSNDELVALLNQPPNPLWIKTHPYISNYRYLPIDKVEYLLKTIFKKYKIEIIREGVAFNGVYVVVRVWYLNPTTNEMDYHDGIGAKELQVKKGSSAADLANINSGALQMAFPIAKTVAIKDACDHFGTLFGSDINRKDVMYILPDDSLGDKSPINEINDIISPVVNHIEVISPEVIPVPDLQFPAPNLPPIPPDADNDDF